MNVEKLKSFCLALPSSDEVERGTPSNILTYKLFDRNFAYFKTSEPERWRFSVRVSPDRFLELTDQPGIKPAKYMQRFYWVTIVNVAAVDENYLEELVLWSYHKVKASLSKKRQASIGI